MYENLKKLCFAPSVSGREQRISALLEREIAPYADEVWRDALGNLFALRRGASETPRRVMLCAHMDEIGFFVTYIEDSGYLRIANVGGIDFVAAANSSVVSQRGVKGVLVRDNDSKDQFTFDRVYLDIGAKSKKDAERRVKVGDFFVLEPSLRRLMHRRVAGRPLDDRVGCAVLLEIAKQLSAPGVSVADDVYYVFSVQEEVGCRGAETAAYAVRPEEAIVFDVTATGDKPGDKPMACTLGGGAAIKLKDGSLITDGAFAEELTALVKAKGIPYQHEILLRGGTDTSKIQLSRSGCRVAALSIPARYLHSGTETVDLSDAQACADLAVTYLTKEQC